MTSPVVMSVLAAALVLAAVLVWPRRPLPWTGPSAPAAPRTSAPSPTTTEPATALLQVLEAVAAQVRGGAAPSVAWDAAVDVLGAAGLRLPRARDAPLAGALRQWGGVDRVALSVAAAWSLAEDVGAPLADLLDELAAALRAEAEVDAEIASSLAAPRATAQLLAVLPVAGVGLGQLMGAGPLHVLLTTPVGRLSGLVGVGLAIGGHLWSRRLVSAAAATT